MLDSGAMKSVINLSTLKDTAHINNQDSYRLYRVSGTPIKIAGTIDIELHIEGSAIIHTFIVSEEDLNIKQCSGLVGIDFIQANGISLLLPQNKMKIEKSDNILLNIKQLNNDIHSVDINTIDTNINTKPFQRPLAIKLMHDTLIPPCTQHICSAVQEYYLHGQQNILLSPASQIRHGIITPSVVVKQDKNLIVPIIITNITRDKITLKKGTIVSFAHTYKQVNNEGAHHTINSIQQDNKNTVQDPTFLSRFNLLHVPHEQRQLLENLLLEYEDIFVGRDGKIGLCPQKEYVIDVGDIKPIIRPGYKIAHHLRPVMDK
jgi:hypothetical protein